jgi:Ca2+-binding EF-hand superfamily protein
MMLPCEDNYLRNRTLDRHARYVGRFDRLSGDIEHGVVAVLQKEIDMQRRLESLKRELDSRPWDYNIGSAFRAIDRYNMGRIDSMQLGTFLRANGHYLPEMELIAIIRRLDTDGDAVISYSEFSEFMRPAYPMPSPAQARPSTPPRRSSQMNNSSPLKSSTPARARSANRTAARTSSPIRSSPTRTSPSRKPILGMYDEDALVSGLKGLCDNEQELEQAKIRLGTQPDFNVRDAFEIFDQPRYGTISVHDLQSGLNAIGVHPTYEECELFVTRYDKSGDRRLQFHEFQDAFLAVDSYWNRTVSMRPSNYTPRPIRRDDCFRYPTTAEFQSMWRTHFRVESASESFRRSLAMRPSFNCYEAFNSLDMNDSGAVSASELKRMIESRGYFVGFKEVDQVVDKFDKNKNGRITFSEFREETLPKSPARR